MKLNSTLDGSAENRELNKSVDEALRNKENKEKKEANQTETNNADDFFEDILDNSSVKTEDNSIRAITDKPRFGKLTPEDRQLAVYLQLIPESYKDTKFSVERIIRNIKQDWIESKKLYLTYDFEDYTELCMNILSTIRLGQLPSRSYIIGAPNGFGKSSFVNECIMTLNKNCYRVAPYISLYELGEIRKIDSDIIMKPYSYTEYYKQIAQDRKNKQDVDKEYLTQYTQNGLKGNHHIEPRKNPGLPFNIKQPEAVHGQYSYSEYINAACVFVALSGISSKDVESHELLQLMNIRGMKGLPTIVTVGTSLDPYTADIELREQVWDSILTRVKDNYIYDRLYHVSSYRFKSISRIDNKDTYKDEETGIVYKHRGDKNEHK